MAWASQDFNGLFGQDSQEYEEIDIYVEFEEVDIILMKLLPNNSSPQGNCTRGWWEDMKVPSQSSNVWERYLPSTTSIEVQKLSSLLCERSQSLSRKPRWLEQKQVQLCTNNCSHLQW